MIEPCFNFLNISPVANDSLCSVRIYPAMKKKFFLVIIIAFSMPKVDVHFTTACCELPGNKHDIRTSVKWGCSKERYILHSNHFTYPHNANTIVFTILPFIKQTEFHSSNTVITESGLCGNVIYFYADTHCVSWEILNTAKLANSTDNGGRDIELDSLDGGDDGEHNGVSFIEISKTFAMRDAFFLGRKQTDGE